MKKLSKGFYLGSIAGAGGLGVILIIIATIALTQGAEAAGFSLLLFGFLLSIYGGVISLILWYKGWQVIQDGHARTTPGKAIGFLFIPFFGFYWIFQAYWGFAKDYNSHLNRHSISGSKLPEGLFLTTCILSLVGIPMGQIPVLGLIFSVVSFGIWIAVMNKVCDAVNNIVLSEVNPQEQTGLQTEQTVQQAEKTEQQTEDKVSGLAIAGLVCALAGLVPFCGAILAIVGLILGIVAFKKINRSGARVKGRGLAIGAISVGGALTALWFLIMPAIMIPAILRSRVMANKGSTLSNIVAIETALAIYNIENIEYPQDLSTLVEEEYLNNLPTDAWGKNYIYRLKSSGEFELFSLGPDGIEGTDDDIYSGRPLY